MSNKPAQVRVGISAIPAAAWINAFFARRGRISGKRTARCNTRGVARAHGMKEAKRLASVSGHEVPVVEKLFWTR